MDLFCSTCGETCTGSSYEKGHRGNPQLHRKEKGGAQSSQTLHAVNQGARLFEWVDSKILRKEMATDGSQTVTRRDRAHWHGVQCKRDFTNKGGSQVPSPYPTGGTTGEEKQPSGLKAHSRLLVRERKHIENSVKKLELQEGCFYASQRGKDPEK